MEVSHPSNSTAIEGAIPANGPSRLRSQVSKPSHIDSADRAQMYLLMRKYYAGLSEERFLADLHEKHDVILLRDGQNDIRGFSTLLQAEVLGVRTVFSGDTIVDREYWGQKELGMAFLKYLFFEKLKHPLKPLYWMLMSKGYKTYLIMANNFRTHFPRYERPTPPRIQFILDAFYGKKFGQAYDSLSGIIRISDQGCHLREGVAAVTPELRAKIRRVDFFAERNPGWDEGQELACMAEMTLYMPFYYLIKKTLPRYLRRSGALK